MTTSLKQIQELLTTKTGTEGSLLIMKTIASKLFEDVDPLLIGRQFAAQVFGPGDIQGSSIDLDLEDENSMQVEKVAEGAAVVLGNPTYASSNVKPVKYGIRPLITREMLEDSKWNLAEHALRRAVQKFAENENSLIVTALDGAANTVSGGAAITLANISRAQQYLNDNSYKGRVLLVGPEVLADLQNLDALTEAEKYGSREMHEKGIVGHIYGMDVHLVSTDGLTGYTSTSAYVFDPEHAFVIAEKRPVTVEEYDDAVHDMQGIVITQRLAVAALRTKAIAKITTS